MASGDSIAPTVFPVNAGPSDCASVIFSGGLSPSARVAVSLDGISSFTRMFAPPSVSVPSHRPAKSGVATKGECGSPILSLGWLHCGRIVASIWLQKLNADSRFSDRFVKTRHARFSEGTRCKMVATPGCPPPLKTTGKNPILCSP